MFETRVKDFYSATVKNEWRRLVRDAYHRLELDTTLHFLDIHLEEAMGMEYSDTQDAIGHDWKSVTVDEGSNSAEYRVRPGYTYVLRDTESTSYKFRFMSYVDSLGVKGYPSLEFANLNLE